MPTAPHRHVYELLGDPREGMAAFFCECGVNAKDWQEALIKRAKAESTAAMMKTLFGWMEPKA